MSYLTADASLQALLCGVKETVEIRDTSGKILGHYTPAPSPEEAARARAANLFDLAEAERVAATERDGAPLEEILRRLQSSGAKG
jgi:hypothetical protein